MRGQEDKKKMKGISVEMPKAIAAHHKRASEKRSIINHQSLSVFIPVHLEVEAREMKQTSVLLIQLTI
jgi:hypothetical protein